MRCFCPRCETIIEGTFEEICITCGTKIRFCYNCDTYVEKENYNECENVCDDCTSIFETCDMCGEIVHVTEMEDGLCRDCSASIED